MVFKPPDVEGAVGGGTLWHPSFCIDLLSLLLIEGQLCERVETVPPMPLGLGLVRLRKPERVSLRHVIEHWLRVEERTELPTDLRPHLQILVAGTGQSMSS